MSKEEEEVKFRLAPKGVVYLGIKRGDSEDEIMGDLASIALKHMLHDGDDGIPAMVYVGGNWEFASVQRNAK